MSLLFRHRTPFLWTPTTHLAHFVVNSVILIHYLINAITILFPTIENFSGLVIICIISITFQGI